jgi:hypothetical protein
MRWLGTRFEFPRLTWMLIWTCIYIAVIGVVNFMVLRRIGKVELGWITVPALALLFGVVFYFFSVRGRMTRFGVDEITICWMDDKSATAASESRIRVASPRLQEISLQVPREAVLHDVEFDPLFRASDVSDVWNEGQESGSRGFPIFALMRPSIFRWRCCASPSVTWRFVPYGSFPARCIWNTAI